MENVYAAMASKIVAEQAKIIGPVAYAQASKVVGLAFDKTTNAATIQGNGAAVVDELVKQYKLFFGDIAVEVSREAVGDLKFQLKPEELPVVLK